MVFGACPHDLDQILIRSLERRQATGDPGRIEQLVYEGREVLELAGRDRQRVFASFDVGSLALEYFEADLQRGERPAELVAERREELVLVAGLVLEAPDAVDLGGHAREELLKRVRAAG